MMKDIILICKQIKYCSSIDEDLFFEWIKKIPSINKFNGIHDELYLYISSKKIPDQDLRELLALFYRYKVDMKQLQIFLNATNTDWFFKRPNGYWHRKVFGIARKK